MNSKTAFDKSDTCLGRVDTLSVAPPYTVASLKSRIVKAEGIGRRETVRRRFQLFKYSDDERPREDADRESQWSEDTDGEALTKDADREIQLFGDTDGETLMKDADRASFLAKTFPGCLADDPLAFVHGSNKLRQRLTMTRPIRVKFHYGE